MFLKESKQSEEIKKMKIGEQREKENSARNLLRKGMSSEFVTETTELSLERIKEIVKKIIN